MEALGPPPGGDQSRAYSVRVTTLTTFILVFISVCLRMTTRRWVVRQLGWDDLTIVLATIATAISVAINLEGLKYGNGRHAHYLTPAESSQVAKWNSFSQLMLVIITCLTKVSICFFVLRIPTNKNLIRFLYVFIISLFVVNGATSIVLLAQCRPLEALWNPAVKGHCWTIKVYLYIGYLQGAFAIVTDLICTSLPALVLWKVQISLGKKVAICGLMALGLVSSVCCAVRVSLTAAISDPTDESWRLITVEIWAILEQNTGQIAANLPLMPALYRASQKKLPPFSKLRSYFTSSLRGSRDASLTKRSGFSRVDEEGATPLGAFPVRKTVDVDVNEEIHANKENIWPREMRGEGSLFGEHNGVGVGRHR